MGPALAKHGSGWIEREFNACQTPRSMYPSIFSRFPVLQAVKSKGRHFSTFLHILASLGTPLGQSRKCYMDRKRIQCLLEHRSMCPSIFNRFPVIQAVSLKVRHFSTFLHILASPGYAPGTIAVNVTWMERGFNADQTHRSMNIPIYLQPFTSYS